MRSQSFEEEYEASSSSHNNRRQLPNVPKKPARQSSNSRDNSNREPTPDYDSAGDHKTGTTEATKSSPPLASSPVKKLDSPTHDMKTDEDSNADQNANKNPENLRGKKKIIRIIWHEKNISTCSSFHFFVAFFFVSLTGFFSGFGL